jgi:hypothetical protein
VALVAKGFVKARTAQANQIRGLLGEFGLLMPARISLVAKRVQRLLEDEGTALPGSFRQLITRLSEHFKDLDTLVDEFEAQIGFRRNAAPGFVEWQTEQSRESSLRPRASVSRPAAV